MIPVSGAYWLRDVRIPSAFLDAAPGPADREGLVRCDVRIEAGLICGFPVNSQGGKASIVQGVPINDFARKLIDRSVNELKEERVMVSDLLPK